MGFPLQDRIHAAYIGEYLYFRYLKFLMTFFPTPFFPNPRSFCESDPKKIRQAASSMAKFSTDRTIKDWQSQCF